MQKKRETYPFIIQVLQSLLARALPDLHLPRLGDVGLPVDDSPVALAPARRQRVKVQRLAVPGALHRAEHATEFLPGPGGAVGAHALEEGWHFPGGRHAWRKEEKKGGRVCEGFLGCSESLSGSLCACVRACVCMCVCCCLLHSHRLLPVSKRRWSHCERERERGEEEKRKKSGERERRAANLRNYLIFSW